MLRSGNLQLTGGSTCKHRRTHAVLPHSTPQHQPRLLRLNRLSLHLACTKPAASSAMLRVPSASSRPLLFDTNSGQEDKRSERRHSLITLYPGRCLSWPFVLAAVRITLSTSVAGRSVLAVLRLGARTAQCAVPSLRAAESNVNADIRIAAKRLQKLASEEHGRMPLPRWRRK